MRLSCLLPALFGLPALSALVNIEFPHLLIPLKSAEPDTAFKTLNDATVSYNSKTGNQVWTGVNFDVHDINGTTCRLRFLVNTNSYHNPPFSLKGEAPFAINISRIEPKLVNGATTWNNKPAIIEHYDTYILSTASATEIVSRWFQCPAGRVAQFYVHAGSRRDLEVYWYELNYAASEGGPHGIVLEMYD